ncbi:replication initiation factor domain-containing protein, partial [Klebsiella variicola]|uniref:replication initiation factor domain-containing protein n=1 Tax=Klebsiella variicola TaxID=244366 RepID=UPI0027318F46
KNGQTGYVGSRASGKFYRGYEKGKQQGDSASLWFRHEVELRSVNREIPLHVLTDPDRYFCGFYPYLAEVYQLVAKSQPVAEVIPTRQR